MALVMLEVLPRSISGHCKKKLNYLKGTAVDLHLKINESRIRTLVKGKEIHETVAVAIPAGTKTVHFFHHLLTYRKCSFYVGVVVQCRLLTAFLSLPVDFNIIQEAAKSLHHNLKRK